ncbi:hypothetical protein HanIR_Chr07g0307401 [Helianthus annuus]|nr:hypothetical protein HanIR_Chr07g0307401 [Helianthus annuus]
MIDSLDLPICVCVPAMGTDPPAPTPSSRKKLTKSSKKPKFTPKPSVQRRGTFVLPKSDSSDDDSETEQELLHTVILMQVMQWAEGGERPKSVKVNIMPA